MWFCRRKRSFSASRTPSSGSTFFIDAPSPISEEQLEELNWSNSTQKKCSLVVCARS